MGLETHGLSAGSGLCAGDEVGGDILYATGLSCPGFSTPDAGVAPDGSSGLACPGFSTPDAGVAPEAELVGHSSAGGADSRAAEARGIGHAVYSGLAGCSGTGWKAARRRGSTGMAIGAPIAQDLVWELLQGIVVLPLVSEVAVAASTAAAAGYIDSWQAWRQSPRSDSEWASDPELAGASGSETSGAETSEVSQVFRAVPAQKQLAAASGKKPVAKMAEGIAAAVPVSSSNCFAPLADASLDGAQRAERHTARQLAQSPARQRAQSSQQQG